MTFLKVFFWLLVVIAIALCAGWLFRQLLVRFSSAPMAKFIKTAPLTAGFGMLVITIYVICAVFAPLIAPYGEAAILTS